MQWKSGGCARLFCLILAGATASCAPPAAVEPPPEHQGTLLRVACPDELTAALVRNESRRWAAQQGATVEMMVADRTAAGAKADIWLLSPAELPRWAQAERLRELPAAFKQREEFNWGDLLPQYRELLQTWDRKTYAVPLVGEGLVCCYRADRFGDEAEQKAFQARYGRALRPPTSWEEFADLAEFFTRTTA